MRRWPAPGSAAPIGARGGSVALRCTVPRLEAALGGHGADLGALRLRRARLRARLVVRRLQRLRLPDNAARLRRRAGRRRRARRRLWSGPPAVAPAISPTRRASSNPPWPTSKTRAMRPIAPRRGQRLRRIRRRGGRCGSTARASRTAAPARRALPLRGRHRLGHALRHGAAEGAVGGAVAGAVGGAVSRW